MNNLFEPQTIEILKTRINKLNNEMEPLWGQMNVPQMMAHCVEVMKNGLAITNPPRKLIGYLISPFWRHKYFNDVPYKIKNLPSYESFKITDQKELELEQKNLLKIIELFHTEGPKRCKDACHPLLGRFTPEQWAIGQYKHLDHHLRQFGV